MTCDWLHWRPPPGLCFEVSQSGFIRIVKARSPRENPDNYLGTDRRARPHWLRMPLSALRQARRTAAASDVPRFLPLLRYDTDLPKRVRRQIHLVERQIATLPHEVVWIFTPAGQVLTPSGVTEHRAGRIRVSQSLGGLMAGNIVTHNHPGGTSFSLKDVKTAIRYNALEIRAVGMDATGIVRTYRLRRPVKEAWPAPWVVRLQFDKVWKESNRDPRWRKLPSWERPHDLWTRIIRTSFPSLTYTRMP